MIRYKLKASYMGDKDNFKVLYLVSLLLELGFFIKFCQIVLWVGIFEWPFTDIFICTLNLTTSKYRSICFLCWNFWLSFLSKSTNLISLGWMPLRFASHASVHLWNVSLLKIRQCRTKSAIDFVLPVNINVFSFFGLSLDAQICSLQTQTLWMHSDIFFNKKPNFHFEWKYIYTNTGSYKMAWDIFHKIKEKTEFALRRMHWDIF